MDTYKKTTLSSSEFILFIIILKPEAYYLRGTKLLATWINKNSTFNYSKVFMQKLLHIHEEIDDIIIGIKFIACNQILVDLITKNVKLKTDKQSILILMIEPTNVGKYRWLQLVWRK